MPVALLHWDSFNAVSPVVIALVSSKPLDSRVPLRSVPGFVNRTWPAI